ncbi:hypothetical protein D9753_26645 [Streptomyces dangxiongensis]|uniref:Lipoprotein n=1 Tax=Streptomyces dangxiongensis TaxID=1442032 RepID=A0A3G2JKD5_9ACTN|nr:hypothetical protein [Streptomyces dangxiongensis]AYN41865.1 hypothetical protein D9753_26645 [Streptomyces dangxiongensis]
MGRRGGPRRGVGFLVYGLLAVPLSLSATGCGGPDGLAHPPPGRPDGSAHPPPGAAVSPGGTTPVPAPAPASTSPSAASDTDLCARIVAYWSRRALGDDTYGDYQSMGLSHGQYQILRDVVDAARITLRRQGAEAADELIDRQTRRACTERYRHGPPSEGPWT